MQNLARVAGLCQPCEGGYTPPTMRLYKTWNDIVITSTQVCLHNTRDVISYVNNFVAQYTRVCLYNTRDVMVPHVKSYPYNINAGMSHTAPAISAMWYCIQNIKTHNKSKTCHTPKPEWGRPRRRAAPPAPQSDGKLYLHHAAPKMKSTTSRWRQQCAVVVNSEW